MNKKGGFESILFAVVIIVIIGIILVFMNNVNEKLYDKLDVYMEGDVDLNNTEAHIALQDIHAIEKSNIWDWVFLAIFIGMIIQMLIFSFASRTNIVFFWIFVILAIVILIAGVILSNIWQEIASNPEFSETILRFPITNSLLGNYFPTAVVAIIFLGLIVLFGKFSNREN